MRKSLLSAAAAMALVVASAIPASAGETGWTSANGSVSNTKYGAKWYGTQLCDYGAYTSHYGWAGLRVEGKYWAYGHWYFSPYLEASNIVVSCSGHSLDLHRHEW